MVLTNTDKRSAKTHNKESLDLQREYNKFTTGERWKPYDPYSGQYPTMEAGFNDLKSKVEEARKSQK